MLEIYCIHPTLQLEDFSQDSNELTTSPSTYVHSNHITKGHIVHFHIHSFPYNSCFKELTLYIDILFYPEIISGLLLRIGSSLESLQEEKLEISLRERSFCSHRNESKGPQH